MLAVITVVVACMLLLLLRAGTAQLLLMKLKHLPHCPEIQSHPNLINNLL